MELTFAQTACLTNETSFDWERWVDLRLIAVSTIAAVRQNTCGLQCSHFNWLPW